MATHTITLEQDAFDILAREKRGRESYSQVMRRLAEHNQKLQEKLDDEMDMRVALERLGRLRRGESRTYTGEEVRRELGLQG